MVLILNHEQGINLFNNQYFVVLKDLCEIKHLDDKEYTVLLLNIKINEDGLLEDFHYFFEEIVITLKVVAVITDHPHEKLREICAFHNISLLEIADSKCDIFV